MAEKRMFAKAIIDSDAFLELSLSAQALYFHLAMRADDDGFVDNPKKIQRMVGASDEDLSALSESGYIIPLKCGVIVIRHWRVHNYIPKDRYKPTIYAEEKGLISTDEKSRVYKLYTDCIQNVYADKIRLDKNNISVESKLSDVRSNSANCPSLMMKDNKKYFVSEKEIEEYKRFYPDVDIEQSLRNMSAWLNANPTRRKTAKGMKRFINNWLLRTQSSNTQKANSEEIRKTDFENAFEQLEQIKDNEKREGKE